jgi:hypothetical protein
MNTLLALIARLAELGLITQERADDLTTRLEAVDPIDAESITGINSSDNDERTAAEIEAFSLLGNVDDELAADVRTALVDAAQHDDADSALINDVADAIDGLTFVADTVQAIAEADAAERDAALSRIVQPEASDGGDDEGDDGDEGGEDVTPEPTAEGDAPAEDAPVAEPVMAAATPARPRAAGIGARNRGANRAQPQPTPEAEGATYHLLDGGAGRPMGAELSLSEFSEVMAERITDMGSNVVGSDQFVRLGRVRTEYPENQRLGRNPDANAQMIDERLTEMRLSAREATNGADAVARVVTAAGGFCAPRTPIYDYAQLGNARRPVRDFLPSFQADRGGVSWRTAPSLGSMGAVNTDDSGITIWTAANDANPSDPTTKKVFTVDCPELETADVYAVVARLKHGNFMGLYDPETIAVWVHLQEVLQARLAETQLLATIATNSTPIDEPTAILGFARDYLNSVNRLVVAERRRQRMDETEVVDLLAPSWVRSAIRDDLVMEIPGAPSDRLAMAESAVDAWFTVRGIRAGWTADGQYFAAQAADTDPSPYPSQVDTYIFDMGHHVLLDGGRLDIGVERSPTLNDTNDTQTMSEVMENIASRGIFSYRLRHKVCVSGQTAGTVSTTCAS